MIRLGLSPDAFWALSILEWRALAAPFAGEAGLTRAGLETLLQHYPDTHHD